MDLQPYNTYDQLIAVNTPMSSISNDYSRRLPECNNISWLIIVSPV
jgi:hypothetical protein